MQPSYLLAGSYAYDTVLQHPQAFSKRILPEAIDRLNVSFNVESVIDEFGGCAGNIAYNAALLGDKPMLCGNLGHDGERYLHRIDGWGLGTSTLGFVQDQPTAHGWMLTDAAGNQIISFHGGAMAAAVKLPQVAPALWHIAPEDPVNMVKLAVAARARGAEYFFDPGQALPALLEGVAEHIAPLDEVLTEATGIFVNDYEARLLHRRFAPRKLLRDGQFIVRTRGADSVALVSCAGRSLMQMSIPTIAAQQVVDPTGCGDAFRAGFLHAYTRGKHLAICVVLGSLMASVVVASKGGQAHTVGRARILEQWAAEVRERFGVDIRQPELVR